MASPLRNQFQNDIRRDSDADGGTVWMSFQDDKAHETQRHIFGCPIFPQGLLEVQGS